MNIENWRSWRMTFFESAILNFFFEKKKILFNFFPNEKQLGGSYEVSFISALITSESRKRLHSIYYAHDCM